MVAAMDSEITIIYYMIRFLVISSKYVWCAVYAALTLVWNPPDSMSPAASLSPFWDSVSTCPDLAAPGNVDQRCQCRYGDGRQRIADTNITVLVTGRSRKYVP